MTHLTVDVVVEAAVWAGVDLERLASAACAALSDEVSLPPGFDCVLMACDDARIAKLNADFRGKPQPTNVLSWPASDLTPPDLPDDPELGDIAIAYETCVAEANLAKIPLDQHLSHLIVHGILHLLGYDHIDDAQADIMESLEIRTLARMGLPDPYAHDI